MEDARRAGRTSSPDFLRINDGLISRSSSSASSNSVSDALCAGESPLLRGKSKNALASVLDRECDILRADADSGGFEDGRGFVPSMWAAGSRRGTGMSSASRDFFCSSSDTGELSRCRSMLRMAACSSARLSTSLVRPLCSLSSSSLDECGDPDDVVFFTAVSFALTALRLRDLIAADGPVFPWASSSQGVSMRGLSDVGGSVNAAADLDTEGLRRCL